MNNHDNNDEWKKQNGKLRHSDEIAEIGEISGAHESNVHRNTNRPNGYWPKKEKKTKLEPRGRHPFEATQRIGKLKCFAKSISINFLLLFARACPHLHSSSRCRWPRKHVQRQCQPLLLRKSKNEENCQRLYFSKRIMNFTDAFLINDVFTYCFVCCSLLLLLASIVRARFYVKNDEKLCGIGHFCDWRCRPYLFDC